MNIPFRVKKLTDTAKAPTKENEGDLWDLYADDFCTENLKDQKMICVACDGESYGINQKTLIDINKPCTCDGEYCSIPNEESGCTIKPQGRILVKTGISLELPKAVKYDDQKIEYYYGDMPELKRKGVYYQFYSYAVADIRPRSGLALKHGITVLNTPGTIDNIYRKEIGVILYNAGCEPYAINKGDKIAQMLIRPLYPSKMEIVDNINDTGRGGYGSTGK